MLVSQSNFSAQRINNKSNNLSINIPNSLSFNTLNKASNQNASFKGVGSFIKNRLWEKGLENYMETVPKGWGEKFFSWKPISNTFKGLANFKPMQRVYKFLEKDQNNLLFKQPILDLVGCGLYVNAALSNKQVPAEKRGFLAAYDAVNGLTTVVLSVLFGSLAANEKFSQSINKAFFGAIEKKNKTLYNSMPAVIRATFAVVASTIIAKRIIAPLISTPTATYIKSFSGGKKAGKTSASNVPTSQNSTLSNTSELFKRLQQRKV